MFNWNFERNGDTARRDVAANPTARDVGIEHEVVAVGENFEDESHNERSGVDSIEWTMLGAFSNLQMARDVVDFSSVHATRESKCMVCLTSATHKIKTRYLRCKCGVLCTKLVKIVHCLAAGNCVVYARGQNGDCAKRPSGHLTKVVKAEAEKLFVMGATPSQALGKLSKMVPEANMPKLKKLQNCYRYFRNQSMNENNSTSQMVSQLLRRRFQHGLAVNEAFTFGYEIINGQPSIGFGGTEDPFMVGITTKSLLSQLDRDPSSFLFHWDATYKLNVKAYPVLVCGISDLARNFHPIAFFILSKESETEYAWASDSLMELYAEVFGRRLKFTYVMADAGKAPTKAIETRSGLLGVVKLLMCFYHVIANVQNFITGMSPRTKALVYRNIYSMHYSRSADELEHHWQQARNVWTTNVELVSKIFVAISTRNGCEAVRGYGKCTMHRLVFPLRTTRVRLSTKS
ncbi:hypothetical protein Ae201684P_019214 [Aphanomyces euteiches]|uniref:MULE transposase domain-containing protein n=1 Tax=Aphanomyces euteiches TaxID=100861 RepID=A0A6G0WAY2_9STRA|nr:hypothetical protein Ae201684_017161 [Aphanomyces euteiches]KAH9078113.1 hypothetical protein Ae201684P_019214 [Aphanomyces euteiches]